jgi:hypothetical protein
MMITIMIAIAEPNMYISVFDAGGAGVGVAVGCASITLKDVTELDGQ